jgi:hypothetical protein
VADFLGMGAVQWAKPPVSWLVHESS